MPFAPGSGCTRAVKLWTGVEWGPRDGEDGPCSSNNSGKESECVRGRSGLVRVEVKRSLPCAAREPATKSAARRKGKSIDESIDDCQVGELTEAQEHEAAAVRRWVQG